MKSRFSIDPFLIKLLIAIVLASFLPAHGTGASVFKWATNIAIALLFFLHGARLSRDAIVAGASHWRLHLTIFSATFVIFPILGLLAKPLVSPFITHELYLGILFLCCLPATVQSAIAFTSIARGNVPAAVCSASASSLLGVFLTPLLVGLVMSGGGAGSAPISFDAIGKIMLQLLLPFVLGQILRPWIGKWVSRHNALLKVVDQGSILLVVYTAFSEAVIGGLWSNTPLSALISLVVISVVLLSLVLGITLLMGRIFKFKLEDRITLLFCGSKKSLSSGIPIANILFAGHAVGAIVLPLMIFHQTQLIICAVIAGAYARRPAAAKPHSKHLAPARTS
ncbi:bile acid:sodium symporter [Paralcaligenes sp. KSB-10]|jgi:sodium/bile acid cotransporter 7|uniref:bile acid:sodium symporter family protein n=1 Tax=Paralcaligenes sp. KSB-10 TaxID=2901142 RepID=UPI001E576A43|nr:bile acid:sodium symporter family protein [Paralcaligenes sp. KSB-10]UHL65898.1 bile acid:sodium symporter [Paralcaligenes sp. KSB-10]